VVQLGATAEKLHRLGVETLAIMGSRVERVRFYLRHRSVPYPVGADPDLSTHRAYGVPQSAVTPEIMQAIDGVYASLARELALQVSEGNVRDVIGQLDGFQKTESEAAEFERHQVQFTGQFLIDRAGIVRWANIECARDGLVSLGQMPSEEELLTEARAL